MPEKIKDSQARVSVYYEKGSMSRTKNCRTTILLNNKLSFPCYFHNLTNQFLFMVSLADIQAAKIRISPHIIRTPLVYSTTISEMARANVYLKLETLQKAGSFKVRGATNKILSAINTSLKRGLVAASAGNHGQGVAVAVHSAGIPATIVMPEWSPLSKQEATRGYGGHVIKARR